jgi:hypothetical protein
MTAQHHHPESFETRHKFAVSYLYVLPFFETPPKPPGKTCYNPFSTQGSKPWYQTRPADDDQKWSDPVSQIKQVSYSRLLVGGFSILNVGFFLLVSVDWVVPEGVVVLGER